MTDYTRRGFIIVGTAGLLSACTTSGVMIQGAPPVDTFSTAGMVARINEVRRLNGKPAWSHNPKLTTAARSQANLMAAKDQLSHDLGVTLRQRVTNAGYDGAVGENVAAGQKTLDQAIEGWLASSGHRNTLLSTKFTEFGIAVAFAPGGRKSRYGTYWALIAGGSFDAWRVYQ